uniref:Uncharacterized protein n=1 Tax=Avena sativa TaxID=4498 RepID=A0ACD5Z7A8_AVESA
MLLDASAKPTNLPLSLLKHITDGFSDDTQIGSGGFAMVYKGKLGNGKVAVKKLFEMFDIDEKRFKEEVKCLMKTKHNNIVRFLGYCSETRATLISFQGSSVFADEGQRLLCFAYLPRGSLDEHITGPSCVLEWRKCYEIIKGICKGLHYLHVNQRIAHLDLKSTNILMDDNMVPKIADFGLSRRFGEKQSRIFTSQLFGTLGYIAPEFLENQQITFKLDIYSLGVIIIEIMTGKKGYTDVDHVLDMWRIRFQNSKRDMHMEQVRVCAQIGIECIDKDPEKRPVMQCIIDRLDGAESSGCSIETNESSSSTVQVEKDSGKLHQWIPKVPGEISYNELSISWDMWEKSAGASNEGYKMGHDRTILMDRYEIGRRLGQGNFAKVYYARNLASGQAVAIKMIDKNKVLRIGLMEQIRREISIMRLVRHPNVLKLYEVMASKNKIYFVLVYAKGGELFNKTIKRKLSEDAARRYFHQLISAVEYCHSRGVYHRDLKLENLLLDENENLKVSDFGLSALVESTRQDGLLHTTCGTLSYIAPEVLSRTGYDGAKADIWSCGVILFGMVAGFLPFHDTNLIEMYRKISKAEYRCPRPFSVELKDLLYKILDPDPSTRASVSRIKRSAWYRRPVEVNALKIKQEPRDMGYKGQSTTSHPIESSISEASSSLANFNAFDIISLSTGFDLSNLFEEKYGRKEDRFTTRQPADAIFAKLNKLAKQLKLKIKKKENGVLKLAAPKEGMKGFLEFDAEVFELAPSLLLVELKKTNGDTIEYRQLMNEEIRPALKDVVWAWQGDSQPLPVPEKIIQGSQQLQSPLPSQQPQE